MSRLFILGNGFDLHHDIQSHFYQYGVFLKEEYKNKNYIRYVEGLKKYFNIDIFSIKNYEWNALERKIVFDESQADDLHEKIEERKSMVRDYIPSIFDDRQTWGSCDAEAQLILEEYETIEDFEWVKYFGKSVCQWAKTFDLKKINQAKKIKNITSNDYYFTFNYSLTLEEFYKIPCENICHIHGDVANDNCILSGFEPVPAFFDLENKDNELDTFTEEYICDNDIYDQEPYGEWAVKLAIGEEHANLSSIKKDCNANIHNMFHHYDKYYDVTMVVVIGHSLDKIDLPYFFFLKYLLRSHCRWIFVYDPSIKSRDDVKNLIIKIKLVDVCDWELLTFDEFEYKYTPTK